VVTILKRNWVVPLSNPCRKFGWIFETSSSLRKFRDSFIINPNPFYFSSSNHPYIWLYKTWESEISSSNLQTNEIIKVRSYPRMGEKVQKDLEISEHTNFNFKISNRYKNTYYFCRKKWKIVQYNNIKWSKNGTVLNIILLSA